MFLEVSIPNEGIPTLVNAWKVAESLCSLCGESRPQRLVIVKFEQMVRDRNLRVDLLDDTAGHFTQRQNFPILVRVLFGIRYD